MESRFGRTRVEKGRGRSAPPTTLITADARSSSTPAGYGVSAPRPPRRTWRGAPPDNPHDRHGGGCRDRPGRRRGELVAVGIRDRPAAPRRAVAGARGTVASAIALDS